MNNGDYVAIWLAMAVVSWVIGALMGSWLEGILHRQYCDCERCKAWRQKMTERGKKQEPK